MARQRKKEAAAAPDEADAKLNTNVDPAVRRQMDAYIADHNARDEHPASIRSTIEAALKMFLREKGFWPPKAV